jgi:SulP family sulfate permease
VLWLAALSPEALALVQGSPLGARLGRERMFFTVAQAVEHYKNHAPERVSLPGEP